MPSSQMAPPATAVAALRLSGVFSSKSSTVGSNSEMEEVSAAKVSKMKKSTPSKVPPVMLPKAIGRVMKIRPGPDEGSR